MSERIDFYYAAPAGMKALGGVYSYLTQTDLPLTLLERLFLRISQINGCAYCIDMHSKASHKAGESWDKIMLTSVWKESGTLFSDKEKAALRWAECLTLIASASAPDEDYAALQAQFSDIQIVDLNIAIGLMKHLQPHGEQPQKATGVCYRSVSQSDACAAARAFRPHKNVTLFLHQLLKTATDELLDYSLLADNFLKFSELNNSSSSRALQALHHNGVFPQQTF